MTRGATTVVALGLLAACVEMEPEAIEETTASVPGAEVAPLIQVADSTTPSGITLTATLAEGSESSLSTGASVLPASELGEVFSRARLVSDAAWTVGAVGDELDSFLNVEIAYGDAVSSGQEASLRVVYQNALNGRWYSALAVTVDADTNVVRATVPNAGPVALVLPSNEALLRTEQQAAPVVGLTEGVALENVALAEGAIEADWFSMGEKAPASINFRIQGTIPATFGAQVVCMHVDGVGNTPLNLLSGKWRENITIDVPAVLDVYAFVASNNTCNTLVSVVAPHTAHYVVSGITLDRCENLGGSPLSGKAVRATLDGAGAATETGTVQCPCNSSGFARAATPVDAACLDINECTLATDNCSDNATCTNTNGGFTCACNSGFTGDGVTCSDVNECQANTDGCSANSVCLNSEGGSSCNCLPGFTGGSCTAGQDVLVLSNSAQAISNVTAAAAGTAFNVTGYTDEELFTADLALGGWEVVIVDWEGTLTPGTLEDLEARAVADLPMVIFYSGLGVATDLKTALDVSASSTPIANSVVTKPSTVDIDMLNQVESLGASFPVTDVRIVTGNTGFTLGHIGGSSSVIALTNSGNHISRGFSIGGTTNTDATGLNDGAELVANELAWFSGVRVLSYDEAGFNGGASSLPAAIARLGYFNMRVSASQTRRLLDAFSTYTGLFDVVAIDAPSLSISRVGGLDAAVAGWISGGGAAVIMDWNIHNLSNIKTAMSLGTTRYTTIKPLFQREAATGAGPFASILNINSPLTGTAPNAAIKGATLSIGGSTTTAATFDSIFGSAGVAKSGNGLSMVNGFISSTYAATDLDSDTILDIEELWTNELGAVTQNF